ncbi:MAG: NADP-specific glutamate dehydrogenase [Deltaproteobacteria bacterium]|nr:NADP-specific glutamate dehydrogenase [Deltaproteobacteria bacterium]
MINATAISNRYAASVLASLEARIPWETEFLQSVKEVFESICPVLDQTPQYEGLRILERLVEPERVVSFRVLWTDDRNKIQVNRGYRVQFNSALGPYKGGTRFHASVNEGSLKFLAFEQTFKNALTGLPMGSGKGGADFAPAAKSDDEIMRFCQSYMTELAQYIGPETDIPAGDVGVGGREIGFLFGQYKRLTHRFNGSLTGKNLSWGGSRLRPEATGYGVTYFLEHMLAARGEDLEGKRVCVSGFGNVAWGVVKKVTERGGRVITLSGPDGYVHDPDGICGDKIAFMLRMRRGGLDAVKPYADEFGVSFHANQRPWRVPCDVAIPCAIQNELDESDAHHLLENGCRYVVEGANMPVTDRAFDALRTAKIAFAPGKAANAGGVAVSGLEMTQNRTGLAWTAERVDETLRRIMREIHDACANAADRYSTAGDYATGANVAGFVRVAEAMIDQGAV